MTQTLEDKKAVALASLRKAKSVIVALSGGVDSAVLVLLAREALGPENVLAVTANSASLAGNELDEARGVAAHLGVTHEVVETHEMDRPEYRANTGDRCYHCRTELFETLFEIAGKRGIDCVAYGAIAEDLGDYRPGMAAAKEQGAVAPLLDAGLTKQELRELARQAGIQVSEKPASACLASRLPIGTIVTPERLTRVDRAERALKALGFLQLRVRDHDDVARVELAPEELARAMEPEVRGKLVDGVRAAGFRYVALDLEGYRTGSLNPSKG